MVVGIFVFEVVIRSIYLEKLGLSKAHTVNVSKIFHPPNGSVISYRPSEFPPSPYYFAD
jgi:hypothetical protein